MRKDVKGASLNNMEKLRVGMAGRGFTLESIAVETYGIAFRSEEEAKLGISSVKPVGTSSPVCSKNSCGCKRVFSAYALLSLALLAALTLKHR